MAQSPIDILFRRLRFGFIDSKAALSSLEVVNEIFAQELGWDEKVKKQNYEKYQEQIKEMDF